MTLAVRFWESVTVRTRIERLALFFCVFVFFEFKLNQSNGTVSLLPRRLRLCECTPASTGAALPILMDVKASDRMTPINRVSV